MWNKIVTFIRSWFAKKIEPKPEPTPTPQPQPAEDPTPEPLPPSDRVESLPVIGVPFHRSAYLVVQVPPLPFQPRGGGIQGEATGIEFIYAGKTICDGACNFDGQDPNPFIISQRGFWDIGTPFCIRITEGFPAKGQRARVAQTVMMEHNPIHNPQ